jgi:hypothetical protein
LSQILSQDVIVTVKARLENAYGRSEQAKYSTPELNNRIIQSLGGHGAVEIRGIKAC